MDTPNSLRPCWHCGGGSVLVVATTVADIAFEPGNFKKPCHAQVHANGPDSAYATLVDFAVSGM